MYIQIENKLKDGIQEGEFRPGAAIPSERELTDLFGVSRMTVRQAVTNLVNEGLLYREKGRGTFVAIPKVEQPLSGLTSFTEDMRARGMKPSSRLIGFDKVQPDPDIREALALLEEDLVFRVARIRFADEIPMAVERVYLPVKLFPGLKRESLTGSLYTLIEKDRSISHATQRLEAALMKKEDAELLGTGMPAAVLLMERISYLTDGVPFEAVRSTYRADRYSFITEIRRSGQ